MDGSPKSKHTRDELRSLLLSAGREILLEEGLETGSVNLTFKRVFDRVEDRTGVRVTNASVIRRVWHNQAEYQADVLVAIARDEGRPETSLTVQAVQALFDRVDLSSPQARATALSEVCRVGGTASSEAIAGSANWSLWIATVAVATATGPPGQRQRIREALWDGVETVTKFWEQNLEQIVGRLGLRLRPGLTMRQFTRAVTSYAQGCALQQRISGRIERITRPTGPDGEDQEWTLFAAGLEGMFHQFFEPEPEPDHAPGVPPV